MKAYILKLTFEDISPLVWRRVILPAGATFHRLHQTLQFVTNFQSGLDTYHSFGVEIDDYFVTDNEPILDEYKWVRFAGRTVKQPSRIKIDQYLEKNGQLIYNYDFGDDWRILVELEETVKDYYFGYPTLLGGEGIAPPEDVGGPPGYEKFKLVYQDQKHPDYVSTYSWAKGQYYLPLDISKINDRLKNVQYKKTEWQFINHKNYNVISDKYRGEKSVAINEMPNKDLLINYAVACTNLYGIIDYPKLLEIYNAQNETAVSISDLQALLSDAQYTKLLENEFVFVQEGRLVHESIVHFGNDTELLQSTNGKPFYVPEKEELLRYTDEYYYEKTSHQEKLVKMLTKDFFGDSTLMIREEIDDLVLAFGIVDANLNGIVQAFLGRFECKDTKQMNEYVQALSLIANNTRIWENRGHTPHELFELEKHHLKPLPGTPFSVIDGGKTGRNEPCPCGSGKKYKRCCGK